MTEETETAIFQPAQRGDEAFSVYGPAVPQQPVLISVPHAGRFYPDAERARSAVPLAALARLEDRHADALVTELAGLGYGVIVANVARAVIDLNRDPRDIDRRMITGLPHGHALIETAKSRGGLGLFPRALSRIGGLWRAPLQWAEAQRRIAAIHTPYHARIEERMQATRAIYGQTLLLDVHSMPPLERSRYAEGQRPDIVIGDRFGASAATRFSEIARAVALRHGLVPAVNHPYPGTYIAERHGRPTLCRHVLQLEISRDLYLDERLDAPGQGVCAMRAMIGEVAAALTEELRGTDLPVAAE